MEATIAARPISARPISARLAHVDESCDLLARDVTRLAPHSTYLVTVSVPDDGQPRQALLAAGRQAVCAICHLFEGVPADHGIAIHHTDIVLQSFVPIAGDVDAMVYLEIDRDNPRHFLWQYEATIEFRQGGNRVARGYIKCMTLRRTVGDPTMWPHHTRLPAVAA